MLWISFAIIVVFGGGALLLHDEGFIKIKPTALYWFICISAAVFKIFFKKNLIRSLMEEKMRLPDRIWAATEIWPGAASLSSRHIKPVCCMEFFHRHMGQFQAVCATGIMLIFIILQALMVAKHIEADKKENN